MNVSSVDAGGAEPLSRSRPPNGLFRRSHVLRGTERARRLVPHDLLALNLHTLSRSTSHGQNVSTCGLWSVTRGPPWIWTPIALPLPFCSAGRLSVTACAAGCMQLDHVVLRWAVRHFRAIRCRLPT